MMKKVRVEVDSLILHLIKNGKITSAHFWESSAPFIFLPQVKGKTVKERKIALKIFTDVVEEFREEALK